MTMIPRGQVDRIVIAALLLSMIVLFCTSCCPKITESSTSKTDTTYIYITDTVTIYETDTFRTEFNVDSLLAILNAPVPVKDKKLSSTTQRGVTTRLSIKDGKLVCEATIDSLQAVVDSLKSLQINTTNTKTVVKEIDKTETWWQKLYRNFFWLAVAVGAGILIAKTKRIWMPYLPFK